MHSSRALTVLTVLAALAWAAVAVDLGLPRAPVAVSRRILPELAAAGGRERIAEIRWRRPAQPGQPPIAATPSMRLARGLDGQMALEMALAHTSGSEPGSVLDDAVLEDFLSTLELLSYTRMLTERQAREHGTRSALGLEPARLILEIELVSGQVITLQLGERIPAIDRVWLARGDRQSVYLIEGYAARALDRSIDDVRSRRVFAVPPGRMRAIEIHAGDAELLLTGSPAMVHAGELGGHVRADAERVRALAEHLSTLTITHFVSELGAGTGPHPGAGAEPNSGPDSGPDSDIARTAQARADHSALTIRVVGPERTVELADIGPCPLPHLPDGDTPEPLRLVTTSIGTGCASASALAEVARAAADAQSWYARALFDDRDLATISVSRPGSAAFILRARGSAWMLATAPPAGTQTQEQPAESEAVRQWLSALHGSPDGRYLPARSVTDSQPRLALAITHSDGSTERISLSVHPQHGLLARRLGEPVYLMLQPAAAALVAMDSLAFRPRQLLMLEPYGLREAIAYAGTHASAPASTPDRNAVIAHLIRGELLDEWHARVPAGRTVRARSVAALRELGRLRARAFIAAAATPSHGLSPPRRRIEVLFDPGPLAADSMPVRHIVELGRATANGCMARLDSDPTVFELDRRTCDPLLAPWVE